MLPNNSAWVSRVPYTNKEKELKGYTNCTAIENGWVWRTPTWSRMGSGYVYSDKFVDDDTAEMQLKQHLGVDDIDFRRINIRHGIHKEGWVKNVVAIGLSYCFVEPLESSSVQSYIEMAIYVLTTGGVVGIGSQVKQYIKEIQNFVL